MRRTRSAGRLGWLTGALVLVVVVLLASHVAEERALVRLLRASEPRWLLGAAALQALTYVCAAAVWQRAVARRSTPLLSLALGLAKLSTDQAVPSAGVSGTPHYG